MFSFMWLRHCSVALPMCAINNKCCTMTLRWQCILDTTISALTLWSAFVQLMDGIICNQTYLNKKLPYVVCLPCSAAAALVSVPLYPLLQRNLSDHECFHSPVNLHLFVSRAFKHTHGQRPSLTYILL